MPLFRRADASLVRDVPAYRQIMPLLMRKRNESVVYFEQNVDAGNAFRFIDAWNEAHPETPATFFHLLLHEVVTILHERPRLNRFVSGGRHYQRDGIWISYSAKKALNDDAPIVALKQRFDPRASFAEHVAQLQSSVREGRGSRRSHTDKELALVFLLPIVLVRMLVALVRWLDAVNLLPNAFMRTDPMYASVFIANLGSIKLDAAYHHLYEYGNIPVFGTIGRLREVPFARADGTLASRKEITLRWSFDERIEDGLYCARSLEVLRERLEGVRDPLTGTATSSAVVAPKLKSYA